TELQKVLENGTVFGHSPKLDLAVEKTRQDQLLQAIREGAVQSAHDIAEGGFAVALSLNHTYLLHFLSFSTPPRYYHFLACY
ncbi:hypothetical protein L6R34_30540, partial [Escherichia coli]|nr:hypothetical protein [Escherichia coli]